MGAFALYALTSWWVIIPTGHSRGTRVVKGAGFRSQCVVLRRFKSCPLHHYLILILFERIVEMPRFFASKILYTIMPMNETEINMIDQFS